jgi:chitinase
LERQAIRFNTSLFGRLERLTGTPDALNKAILHIDTWLPQLEQAYATPTQRDNAVAGGNDPEALAASARISKIDMLRNQWTNNRPVWNNPF